MPHAKHEHPRLLLLLQDWVNDDPSTLPAPSGQCSLLNTVNDTETYM